MKIVNEQEKLQSQILDYEKMKYEMVKCRNFGKAQEIDIKIKGVEQRIKGYDKEIAKIANEEKEIKNS